jgi:hypothetical protein
MKDGLFGCCKKCDDARRHDPVKVAATKQRWIERNPDKRSTASREWQARNAEYVRNNSYKFKYGFSTLAYDSMLEVQGGGCAICSKTAEQQFRSDGSPRRLAVDHCHSTNFVRGILCQDCNRILGLARDNPEILNNAACYLEAAQPMEMSLVRH